MKHSYIAGPYETDMQEIDHIIMKRKAKVTIHGRVAYLLRGCGRKSTAHKALRSIAKRFIMTGALLLFTASRP